MFFFFSKVLEFIISPLNWVILVFVLGLFKKKQLYFYFSFFLLLFFSSPLPVRLAFRWWEVEELPVKEIQQPYDMAIILGGFLETVPDDYESFNLSEAGDRLMKGIELYQDKKVKQLFISGGSGSVLHQGFKEARVTMNFLNKLGIDTGNIYCESNSKNTYENAFFTKRYFTEHQLMPERILIITSAYHMRRTLACYKKQGIEAVPFVVDGGRKPAFKWKDFNSYLMPSAQHLKSWDVIMHEWVGMITYQLAGYV